MLQGVLEWVPMQEGPWFLEQLTIDFDDGT